MNYRIKTLALTTFLIFLANGLSANVHNPFLIIPAIDKAPKIDGIISADEYAHFTRMDDYAGWTLETYDPELLETYIGFDDEFIYVAYRGYFADFQGFYKFLENHKPQDSHMWGRHGFTVSMYNDLGGILLMAGPTLSRADYKDGDVSWNGDWEFEASVNENNWVGEFKIPFSDLGLKEAPIGETWFLGLGRTQSSQAEQKADPGVVKQKANWTGGGNTPETGISSKWNGRVRFEKTKEIYCSAQQWPDPLPGSNTLEIAIENKSQNEIEIIVETELFPFTGSPEFINQEGQGNRTDYLLKLNAKPLLRSNKIMLPAASKVNESIGYDLPEESNYMANLSFKTTDGELIRRNTAVWFGLEPNGEKLEELRLTLGICESHCIYMEQELALNLLDKTRGLQEELRTLQKEKQQYWEEQAWDKYSAQVKEMETKIIQHHNKINSAAYHNWEKAYAFGVTTCNSMTKIPKDKAWDQLLTHEFSISAARNEYESFQLVLLPFGEDQEGIEFEWTDFTNESGHTIGRENLSVEQVGYNYIAWQASYLTPGKGWYPDPLMPFNNSFSLDGEDICSPLWFTAYVPTGTPPGIYKSKISIVAENKEIQVVDISIQVRDFDLPTENSLYTQTWDDISYFAEFYNMESFPLENYLNVCDVLLKNNMSPGFAGVNYVSKTPDRKGIYDFSNVEKVLDFCMTRGLTRFTIVQMKKGETAYAKGELENEYKFIEAYADFLREKGYLDKALVELWDEPTPLQYEAVKERARRIRSIGADIPLQLFADPRGPYDFTDIEKCKEYGLYDLVDIWGPGPVIDAPDVRADGKEIWSYFATLARSSGPNFFMDCPSINHRIIPWMSWQFGLDAFQHWHVNYFWRNIREGEGMENKWPNVPWDARTWHDNHGEGQLVYPGENGEIYPSIRLVNFRDGMDDYEYLNILQTLMNEYGAELDENLLRRGRQVLNIGESLINEYPVHVQERPHNTIKYPDEAVRLLKIREESADLIELILNELKEISRIN